MSIRRSLPHSICLLVALAMLATPAFSQSLTTTFAGGNGQSGNQFDLVGINACTVTSLDVNIDPGTWDMEVYVVTGGGTKVGNENNAAAWTLVGSTTGLTSLGANVATPLPIVLSINIPAGGTQGIYVTVSNGTSINYTNGGAPQAVYASTPDLQFLEGTGHSYPFTSNFNPRVWNGIIYYSTGPGVTDDMSMVSIDSPAGGGSGCSALGAQPVTVTVRNNGTNAVSTGTSVPISYTVDDGVSAPVTVNEVMSVAATMGQGDTAPYTFAAGANLSSASLTYTFSATVSLAGDLNAGNDTVSGHAVAAGSGGIISSFPWVENFDAASLGTTMPAGWVNVQGENIGGASEDWIIDASGTPSANTGPTGDHTTGSGNYCYTEDSSPSEYAAINLNTPCLDLTGSSGSVLEFWVHSNSGNGAGVNENFLAIDILDAGGNVIVVDAVAPIGHLGNNWVQQTVSLVAYSGQIISVQFRGRTDSGSWSHDIAIDDVRVYEPTTQNGQAPQAGLAYFDINNATDPNGFGVPTGVNGPYTANVPTGDAVSMEILGAANQPIMLLTGPLNVAAAVFPGIGQFDIGVAAGGGLSGITIIASGSGSGYFDQFFFTDVQGYMSMGFNLNLPVGTSIPMQCIVYTGGASIVALSNAVVLNSI